MFDAPPDPSAAETLPIDPAIEVCERHLRILREVGEVALEVTRALGAAAVAAGRAVEEVLGDKEWQPETGRARALAGAKDASEAFHKAARALRLTLALEKAAAETLRDLLAGVTAKRRDRAAGSPTRPGPAPGPPRETVPGIAAEVVAEDAGLAIDPGLVRALRERLTEADHFGPLLHRPLIEVVGLICADIGVTPDWGRWMEDGERDCPPSRPDATSEDPPLRGSGPRPLLEQTPWRPATPDPAQSIGRHPGPSP